MKKKKKEGFVVGHHWSVDVLWVGVGIIVCGEPSQSSEVCVQSYPSEHTNEVIVSFLPFT
jgi:hypothetical protein